MLFVLFLNWRENIEIAMIPMKYRNPGFQARPHNHRARCVVQQVFKLSACTMCLIVISQTGFVQNTTVVCSWRSIHWTTWTWTWMNQTSIPVENVMQNETLCPAARPKCMAYVIRLVLNTAYIAWFTAAQKREMVAKLECDTPLAASRMRT